MKRIARRVRGRTLGCYHVLAGHAVIASGGGVITNFTLRNDRPGRVFLVEAVIGGSS